MEPKVDWAKSFLQVLALALGLLLLGSMLFLDRYFPIDASTRLAGTTAVLPIVRMIARQNLPGLGWFCTMIAFGNRTYWPSLPSSQSWLISFRVVAIVQLLAAFHCIISLFDSAVLFQLVEVERLSLLGKTIVVSIFPAIGLPVIAISIMVPVPTIRESIR